MTKPNGWTGVLDVMDDDASDAMVVRREVNANRGADELVESKYARKVVSELIKALDDLLPYAANMLEHDHPVVAKARTALSAAEGGV